MPFTFTSAARRAALLVGLLAGPATVAQAQAPTWQAVQATSPAITYATATVTATAADASGNVYVGGYFSEGIKLGGVTLISAGGEDLFLAKWLPATQSFAWVQRAGGPGDERLAALATSGSTVYLAGSFYGTTALGSFNFTSAGGSDVFVAKFTDAGTSASCTWAQRTGGTGNDRAQALAVSGPSVYLAGSFEGAVSFGSGLYISLGYTDGFVSKLTDMGSSAPIAWTRQVGGTLNDNVSGLAVKDSSVYCTGLFTGTVGFGLTTLASGSSAGTFVAKLTDQRTGTICNWAQKAGGTNFITSTALVVQGSQVYVAGYFFGPAAFGSISLPGIGDSDAFVAKLTDAGTSATYEWARQAGSSSVDDLLALAVQGNRVYLGGSFSATATFGPFTLLNQPNRATAEAYVACLTDTGPTTSFAWAVSAGGDGADRTLALTPLGTALYVGGLMSGLATFGTQTIGSNRNGASGFFTSLPAATGLATAGSAAAVARVAVWPTPTPAGTRATVQLPAATGASLTVFDALGRAVRTARVAAGSPQASLDVAGLAPGFYTVRVAAGETVGTARLVVE